MGLQILGNKLKRKRIGDQSGGMLELKGGGWSVGGNCRPMNRARECIGGAALGERQNLKPQRARRTAAECAENGSELKMLPAGDPETVSLILCDTIRVAESNLLALIVCCRSK